METVAQKINFVSDSNEREVLRDPAIELTGADFDALCAVVLNPPKPNEALKAAFRRYKSLIA